MASSYASVKETVAMFSNKSEHKVSTISMPCFKSTVFFGIPNCVQQSTTAYMVNHKKSPVRSKEVIEFSVLRMKGIEYRQEWIKSLHTYHVAMREKSSCLASAIENELESCKNYYDHLLLMAKRTSIWNCQEFADFALIEIMKKEMLEVGYSAHIAFLNNIKLSASAMESSENHDHAFVVIVDRRNEPQFIVDLWQMFILKVNKPFFGECSSYLRHLKEHCDGVFVRVKEVMLLDITMETNPFSANARKAADDIPGYQDTSADKLAPFI